MTDDLDRELEELDADDGWLIEAANGVVYDWAKLRDVIFDMLKVQAVLFPKRAGQLWQRQPGLDMRYVEEAQGMFEVYSPPHSEDEEPLVVGRFHIDLLRADAPS